jgi:hypothetical protein
MNVTVFARAFGTALIFAYCGQNALAQSDLLAPETNGCGSGWSTFLVPNSVRLLQCEFKTSCDAHDICYGQCEAHGMYAGDPKCEYLRCKAGGDLFKAQICDDVKFTALATAAQQRRKKCDDRLFEDIREANNRHPICEAFAIVYRKAVNYLGNPSFRGIDAFGNRQPDADYRTQIERFFERGTDQQFENLIEDARGASSSVNFGAPLMYSPSKGLTNVYWSR